MSIPGKCTVLVIGGGPAGSYAAAVLAREGIDVIVLEAEKFPRYHIGESMLPSMRQFLKFIDAYDRFNGHGFIKKNGAAFRLNRSQPEAYTDFIAAGGPQGHAWNVVRSEADEFLFKYAGECGAKIFDATKVNSVEFAPLESSQGASTTSGFSNPGKPISATWTQKDGSSGVVSFEYIVDASGRNGVLCNKYLKNRKFNQNLKNVANWAYWKGGSQYGIGTHKEGSPYFEALQDASGWCWFIPLHNGTTSVGLVRNQELSIAKKREAGSPSSKDFYLQSLDQVPRIQKLLEGAELLTDLKSASDWSYSASTYAFPHARIAGDAGCFIDPYFSSGVHLALLGGLSAAVTITASIRGDCDEDAAASWHSKKIVESYTRFYIVVSSAMKQIKSQDDPVIQDIDEDGFQSAFDVFRPVIQGSVDADSTGKLSQSEISRTVEFCLKAFTHVSPDTETSLKEKLASAGIDITSDEPKTAKAVEDFEKTLAPEEAEVLAILRSKRMIREDGLSIRSFMLNAINGYAPRVERGALGLTPMEKAEAIPSHSQSGHSDVVQDTQQGMTNISQNGIAKTNGYKSVNGNANSATFSNYLKPMGEQVTELDEASRHAVMSALHEAAENLETPFDMLMRLSNTGRQLAMIDVGNQLDIFTALSSTSTPLTAEQLAMPHGADPGLVTRVMRYLASCRYVGEAGEGLYTARKATHFLADKGMRGGMKFFHAVSNPAIHHLPSYLAARDFKLPDHGPSVFQESSQTHLELYPWLKTQPEMLQYFQNLMTVPRSGDWLSVVPAPAPDAQQPHRKVFVDVGGNVGHQTSRFKAAYPQFAGRLVMQDLPETIIDAPLIDGVELMPHDFFTPQPVQGAQYYYMRSILHNWDDDRAVEILRNLIPALVPDSQVLIDEMVVPNVGTNIWPAGQDLQMMMMFGAKERTLNEWTELVERAGLKVQDVRTYAPVMRTSIIVATLR